MNTQPRKVYRKNLMRRVHAPRTAPHADDEEHRDQHRFPEEVEQQRVERGEHADHQAFHDQEGGEVLRRALLDDRPRGDDHRHGDERGQQDQRQRDAVDAEVVSRVQRRDPGQLLDELEVEGRGVEAGVQRDGRAANATTAVASATQRPAWMPRSPSNSTTMPPAMGSQVRSERSGNPCMCSRYLRRASGTSPASPPGR